MEKLSTARIKQDINWCLQSPPLMHSVNDPDTWPGDSWFAQLHLASSNDFPTPKDPHHFRLGQLFEAYLANWLQHSRDFRLLANNVQVFEGKQTVGEFDFLVQTTAGVEHWEAAVKFYLGRSPTENLASWYGPNTEDRLDIKYERLVRKQLQLAQHPAAQKMLEEKEITVNRSRCFMKGRLFYPWDVFESGVYKSPNDSNASHEKGWWLPWDEIGALMATERLRAVYLPKLLWLAPLDSSFLDQSISLHELTHLQQQHRQQATHIALLDETSGEEVSRGFLVTDQWLERARPPAVDPAQSELDT